MIYLPPKVSSTVRDGRSYFISLRTYYICPNAMSRIARTWKPPMTSWRIANCKTVGRFQDGKHYIPLPRVFRAKWYKHQSFGISTPFVWNSLILSTQTACPLFVQTYRKCEFNSARRGLYSISLQTDESRVVSWPDNHRWQLGGFASFSGRKSRHICPEIKGQQLRFLKLTNGDVLFDLWASISFVSTGDKSKNVNFATSKVKIQNCEIKLWPFVSGYVICTWTPRSDLTTLNVFWEFKYVLRSGLRPRN